MALRVSAQISGDDIDLEGIVDGEAVATGIPGGKALLAFAETGLGDDAGAIAAARQRVWKELGERSMVDAAGIIANFQRMVRIADGTGIVLDKQLVALTADLRDELGINDYPTARLTREAGWFARLLARLFRPILPTLLRRVTSHRPRR